MARTKYEVLLAPDALDDLNQLRAYDRARIRDALDGLRDNPTQLGRRGRIKRLRGMLQPQYRLRVDDIRVFYDVQEHAQVIDVLAIVPKEKAREWLDHEGEKS